MAEREVYSFGEFTLDPSERRLLRADQPVPLTPKVHDLLAALVRHAGRLVTKRELLDLVWPESHVNEGILAVHVSSLRKVLRQKEDQPCIETVSRYGYRFVAQVRRAGTEPAGSPGAATQAKVYELLGLGRHHMLAASMLELPKAIEAFRAALQIDAAYAPAHASLARAYCTQAAYRLAAPAEAYSAAKVSALQALALDSTSADAQLALGTVLFFSEWNWTGAERSFGRALQLNPNHSEGYLLYGELLEVLGRLDEGLQMKQRALERDPFSPLVHLQISLSYWHQRRYDESIDWAKKTLELDARHPQAREHLAGAYWKKGEIEHYIEENLKQAEVHGVPEGALEELRKTFAGGGRLSMLKAALERAAQEPDAFPAMQLALINGEVGDMDEAFHQLGRAIESHDPGVVHLGVGPQWDALRGDERFSQYVLRMGLPVCSPG